MNIALYLLDLIDESEESEFNMVMVGDNYEGEIRYITQLFPCCNFYSAELMDDDIDQLCAMGEFFDYVVVKSPIDDEKKWEYISKIVPMVKDNGNIVIACPNHNNIVNISDMLKYRSMKDGYSSDTNHKYLYMDIADRITESGLIISKFGLFGDNIDSDLAADDLISIVGDDYTDSINALYLPYIRLSLNKANSKKLEDDLTDRSGIADGYIREVNTFNMYNLVLRKNQQDYDFYMKNLEPVNKVINFDMKANEVLKNKIRSSIPFCALRLGNTEGILIDNYITARLKGRKEYSQFGIEYAFNSCGFFVSDLSDKESVLRSFDDFSEIQLEGFKNADIMMMWGACRMESVIANHFAGPSCENISYFSLIPYVKDYEPWTVALAGKKVLVVTSVPDSIEYQYSRKELISPYTNSILPDFTLITYRMIQTCQGDNHNYSSWFEALEHVKREVLSIDFDIAIVGAGFYGVPLCNAIKQSGRCAIELCGLTPFIFGVAGKRFVEDQRDFYGKYMTDNWIRPFDDKPEWFNQVEGGCYW